VLAVHEVHLTQLFQNLIGNALKYRGPEPPRIRVSAEVSAESLGGMWKLSVADNGIGIDPAYQGQVFGLFQRLHGGGKYAGSGIGLAICQKIVQRYGGRIWVESELERGSRFLFTLPEKKAGETE
jgi:signal transduction histidine kinase